MLRNKPILLIFLIFLGFSLQISLYNDPNIIQLTPDEFTKQIENSLLESQWFIHLYSNSCSQKLINEWQLMAQSLSGLTSIKIAAVDDQDGKISEEYEIKKYPAFVFINSQGQAQTYTGEKTADNFIEFIFQQITDSLNKRINIQKDAENNQENGNQNQEVVILNDENFDKLVMNTDDMWFVDFYAPWCGPCMQMETAWNILAQKLHKKINVGKVNTDQAVNIRNRYRIQSLPTMLFFNKGNKFNTPYYMFQGHPNVWNWANWAIERMPEDKNDVIVLTQDNFDEILWNSDEIFFVKFYAPWCGHCHDMQPAWEKLATYIKPEGIKIAMIDTDANRRIGARFGINAWPTLKLFHGGRKNENNIEEFQGNRNTFEMANWVLERKKNSEPLISQINACKGLSNVCLLAFLPNIQYTDKFTRKDQINILDRIFTNFKYSMKANWIQAGDYQILEDSFQLKKSFPEVVIYNGKKNAYSVMKEDFTYENIGKFVQQVFSNEEENVQYLEKPIPKLYTTEKWDGKDHGSSQQEANSQGTEQYEDL